jgi:hypothetical protein
MEIQKTMPFRAASAMLDPVRLGVLVEPSPCAQLAGAPGFDVGCDVYRDLERGRTSCAHHQRTHHLVVVDANVACAVDTLRRREARTYAARTTRFRRVASAIDLRRFDPRGPRTSPRLVQQAVHLFRSASNHVAHADPCATRNRSCDRCVPAACPFAERMAIWGNKSTL